MSAFAESYTQLDSLEEDSSERPERICNPAALRSMHTSFCYDDRTTSENRSRVQELMDNVSPYDPAELARCGQGDRFNVNFGLATAIKNEAVGAYVDIFTSPSTLVKIVLNEEADEDQKGVWADEMSVEFTTMPRSWDAAIPNMLLLADIFVTHGVAIPWFEDSKNLFFNVASLEDIKFDAESIAVPSMIEAFTIEREMSVTELYSKIESDLDAEYVDGWHVETVKNLIRTAQPKRTIDDGWNFERASRLIKSNRIGFGNQLPSVRVIWGVIRELDGKISVYATHDSHVSGAQKPSSADVLEKAVMEGENESWLYKKRNKYTDSNRVFQIFPFSVGNKNKIYTIRGLGYYIYEAGQADNILRNKLMDAARHRASEIYQTESTVDSLEDIQFLDLGHMMLAPKGLRVLQQPNSQRLDDSIGFAIEQNKSMLDRQSAGLASSSITTNPTARRNELQVTAELEHMNKMTSFAISLFYAPYDKLMRELVRRAFTETQTNLVAMEMVNRMKERLKAKGVPEDIFDKIDFAATQATRVMGAGSRSSRVIAFEQMSQLYSSMDPQGQEFFMFDFASELHGTEKASRYFGVPGTRRSHTDVSIAQLENNDLEEGVQIDPVDGENKMVHLQIHLDALLAGIEAVNQGTADMADWTMRNIPLYSHTVDTLEKTTVHESRIKELNLFRQQVQQVGEVIDNGLRHINKMQREGQLDPAAAPQIGPDGQPIPQDPNAPQGQTPAQLDNQLKMQGKFQEAQAKIMILQQNSEAKMAIQKQESMAKITIQDAEAAARIRRQEAMVRAGAR